ncbi:MAG: hypothetical protein ABJA67_13455 [Chthonomonadales bacterium]
MNTRMMALMFWVAGAAVSIFALFGNKCPAEGCPACKLVGK